MVLLPVGCGTRRDIQEIRNSMEELRKNTENLSHLTHLEALQSLSENLDEVIPHIEEAKVLLDSVAISLAELEHIEGISSHLGELNVHFDRIMELIDRVSNIRDNIAQGDDPELATNCEDFPDLVDCPDNNR